MKFGQLIIATNNRDKITEIGALLSGLDIELLTKTDFAEFPDVEETGATLAENALLKSRAIFEKYGIPAVADDTGLEVDYLNGAPGVRSSRYAGEGCSYADNCSKLLDELKGVPLEKRRARFVTFIGVSYPGADHLIEGAVDGLIALESAGENGFGYDPVFLCPPLKKTFAQMTVEEKNRVSHRGVALGKLRDWLAA